MKRFDRVKQFLQDAVNNQDIGAHGNFWQNVSLADFKALKVLGRQLLVLGNPDDSNLIKSLEGRAPFGRDIGTAGASLPRMPKDLPPMPPDRILYIRNWIKDGCPDQDE